MLKVKDRSNESVTDTLKIALDKNWKYEEIIEIGNMFSIDIMSEKYVNWYKEVMAYSKP